MLDANTHLFHHALYGISSALQHVLPLQFTSPDYKPRQKISTRSCKLKHTLERLAQLLLLKLSLNAL